MKDIIKYIGILILIVFSFYYTDKISMMIIYESDLMKQIVKSKGIEEKPSQDAIINDDYITPGLNGLSVNEIDSYYQMKKDYLFSSSKLVFDEVEPNTSLEKNKDLIINKANPSKKAVAIIIKNNKDVESYVTSEKMKINKLISYDDFNKDSDFEQINNDKDRERLDVLLNKYKLNTNICLVNEYNLEMCKKNRKYLIKPTYIIDNSSIVGLEINSGDIIYISDDLSLSNFKVLLKKIYYRNLDIILLSKLISEKRNV